jgi:hypothetical protein
LRSTNKQPGWRLEASSRVLVLADLEIESPLTNVRIEASKIRETSKPTESRGLGIGLGMYLQNLGARPTQHAACEPPILGKEKDGITTESIDGWEKGMRAVSLCLHSSP